jgi:uncharacterized protein (TIGR00369 family)
VSASSPSFRPATVPGHYLAQLAADFTYDADGARGRMPVRTATFAPRTSTVRSSVLITLQDLLSGYMSGTPAGPTVDVRLIVHGRPPTTGSIHADVRPLRFGRRTLVGSAHLRDDDGTEFARGISTFLRLDVAGAEEHRGPPDSGDTPLDELIAARALDETSMEFVPDERHRNSNADATVQGGVQAYLAELCAERALGNGRAMTATDLDVRFLRPQRSPQLVARADVVATSTQGGTCSVSLLDGGDADQLTAFVTLTMQFAE